MSDSPAPCFALWRPCKYLAGLLAFAAVLFWASLGWTGMARASEVAPPAESAADPAGSVYRIMNAQKVGPLDPPPRQLNEEILRELQSRGFSVRAHEAEAHRATGADFYYVHEGIIYSLKKGNSCYRISGQGHFITDYRVGDGEAQKAFILSGSAAGYQCAPFTVLWRDGGKQTAVLEAPALATGPAAVFADPAGIKAGQKVSALGFAYESDGFAQGSGLLDAETFVTPKIYKSSLVGSVVNANGIKVWDLFSAATPGSDGGPLVNVCGQVAATMSPVNPNLRGMVSTALSLEELLPELDRLGIAYARAEGPCRADAPQVTNVTGTVKTLDLGWLYYALGGIGALVTGFGAYLLYLRRQVRRGYMPQINSRLLRDMLGMSGQKTGSTSRQKPAAGAREKAVASGGAAGAEKAAAPGAKSKDAPLAATALRIQPLFAGAQALRLIAGDKALIGRDPACALAINDRIISQKHCEVSLATDGLAEVRDLGSANGLYAMGLKGRVKALRLAPGEGFFLADKKYSFRVERQEAQPPEAPPQGQQP